MTVHMQLKQLKKRGAHITACPYELTATPETLRQLIIQLVTEGVAGYNARLGLQDAEVVLSQADMEAMEQIGKIGFGIPYGSREADLEDALDAAIQGYKDGLFRIFVGDRETEDLDAPLNLQENDTITIIRLVMLTGGYF